MEIELDKSVRERIFHAVIFEVTANVIIALSLAWLMNVSVLHYRIAGASKGADMDIEVARKYGLSVYTALEDIPEA
ncbi:hypothetical protein CWR52_23330 [Enterobacter sp. SGAir0187]|nr:chlorhexidine efflux transporter [Enterobacter sp. SGAir0187]AZL49643.1 hypothetical protein CWR52_23330 [Enterobacter sp. SGAir0187]